MAARAWVIRRKVVLWIGLALVAYVVLADVVGFYPFGRRVPRGIELDDRLLEILGLWLLLCLAVLLIPARRKSFPSADALIWPVAIQPVVFGLMVGIVEGWKAWRDGFGISPDYIFAGTDVVFPAFMGGLAAVMFVMIAMHLRDLSKKGICFSCGYDLRGAASNRCPECGLQIDEDGTAREPGAPRTFPELLLFETAKQRDDAWQCVWGQLRWATGLLGVVVMGLLALVFYSDDTWGEYISFSIFLIAAAALGCLAGLF